MLPCTAVDIQLCNFVPLEVPFRNSCTAVDLQLYSCRSTTRVLYAYKLSLHVVYMQNESRSIKSGLFIESYQVRVPTSVISSQTIVQYNFWACSGCPGCLRSKPKYILYYWLNCFTIHSKNYYDL